MRKYGAFALLFLLFSVAVAKACLPNQSTFFKATVSSLNINMDELLSSCNEQTCLINKDNKITVTMRSIFDPKVGLEISQDSISIQLPFKEDFYYGYSDEQPKEAKEFLWKECVKMDFGFLKIKEIVQLDDDAIENISSLIKGGEKVIFETGKWMLYEVPPTRAGYKAMSLGGCGEVVVPLDLPQGKFIDQ